MSDYDEEQTQAFRQQVTPKIEQWLEGLPGMRIERWMDGLPDEPMAPPHEGRSERQAGGQPGEEGWTATMVMLRAYPAATLGRLLLKVAAMVLRR
ncbi:uncharacterized protein LTR77_008756 [Saxophila tyrrhenica]|uniref:Uncharacterized protein n=1 Tax=Saxophila tyrrhenica TaxID=1690608 RepID=A0AAV9P040_9PEZI|nr:hypothetical protein LTR77_008756 [Saxophila tyrrhenica]